MIASAIKGWYSAGMACLPYWHNDILKFSTKRIQSGCSLSGMNVACDPEQMRAAAERWLNENGYWKGKLPMEVYTVARYVASEVGNGTPEEKVGVAEAAVGQAKLSKTKTSVVDVLLYRTPGTATYGYYGKIGKGYIGRWASTALDPCVVDIEVARFVLAGESRDFSTGALDQMGYEYMPGGVEGAYADIRAAARGGKLWVGHLPGVNPWRTMLQRRGYGVPAEETIAELKRLISWRLASVDWPGLGFSVCPKPLLASKVPVPAVIVASLVVGFGLVWLASGRPTPKLDRWF